MRARTCRGWQRNAKTRIQRAQQRPRAHAKPNAAGLRAGCTGIQRVVRNIAQLTLRPARATNRTGGTGARQHERYARRNRAIGRHNFTIFNRPSAPRAVHSASERTSVCKRGRGQSKAQRAVPLCDGSLELALHVQGGVDRRADARTIKRIQKAAACRVESATGRTAQRVRWAAGAIDGRRRVGCCRSKSDGKEKEKEKERIVREIVIEIAIAIAIASEKTTHAHEAGKATASWREKQTNVGKCVRTHKSAGLQSPKQSNCMYNCQVLPC